jgi:YfiH family protein
MKDSPASAKKRRLRAPGVVSLPAWEALQWLRAGFSTRQGGASMAYGEGELNLGWTSEDPPEIVAQNRKRFNQAVTGKSRLELATVQQFHSGMIRIIEKDHGPLATADGKAVLRGDGVMTDVPGILLGVQTADCIPVLVADKRTYAVAAFHAGWRGTVARIVERGIGTMQHRYGSRSEDLVAAVGPGIGTCCYAVGEEVRSQFESQFAYAPELFRKVLDSEVVRSKYSRLFRTARASVNSDVDPQLHIDLWEANRRQLIDAGIPAKNITVVGECTGCKRSRNGARRYFSHRMEHGYAGRMMSVIGIAG